MVWTVSEALVIDSSPAKMRGASIGKIVMAANLGMVLGPFIGAALFSAAQNVLGLSLMDSYKFPFYFTALLSLGDAALVWVYVTDAIPPVRERTRMSLRSLLHPEGMDRQGARNLKILYSNALMEGFAFATVGPLLYPACLEVCPTGARVFGNVLDPNSEINYVLNHKRVYILKEDVGTVPRFYYFFDV